MGQRQCVTVSMRRLRRREVCQGLDKPDGIEEWVFRYQLEKMRAYSRPKSAAQLTWPMACSLLRTVRIILNKAATTVGSATLSMGCMHFRILVNAFACDSPQLGRMALLSP